MPSHILSLTWIRGSEQIPTTSTPVTITADGEINADISIDASAVDKQATIAIDVSVLKCLVLSCDKGLTIQTNDGTTPDDTLTLTANEPLIWWSTSGITCPLTVDVTDLYCTRAGADAATGTATLKVRSLQDVTP